MKKLTTIFVAIFSLVWLTGAGWLPLVKSGVPALVYVGSPIVTLSGTQATATNASTGGAGLTVVVITDSGASASGYTCTIGSSGTMTQVASSAAINALVNIQALTTPGGTQTITCTVTSGTGPNGAIFDIYTITNLNSTTATGACPNTNSSSASTLTCTTGYNTTSGGVAIAGSMQQSNNSSCPGSCSYSGIEIYTTDHTSHPGGFGQGQIAHALNIGTNSPSSITFTWNGTSAVALAAAAWR
jgi:hypothetical protein